MAEKADAQLVQPVRIGVVYGTFHRDEATIMLLSARKTAAELGLMIAHEVPVPGSMEKPLAVKRLLLRPEIAGVAVLGIIERGETKHGLVMGHVVTSALIGLQLELMKPIGIGILGPEIDPPQFGPRLLPYAAAAVRALAAMLPG